MIEKSIGLTNERHQLRQQQAGVCRLEDVDVTRADPIEVRNRDLALIGAALTEQYLAGPEAVGEGSPIGDVTSGTDA